MHGGDEADKSVEMILEQKPDPSNGDGQVNAAGGCDTEDNFLMEKVQNLVFLYFGLVKRLLVLFKKERRDLMINRNWTGVPVFFFGLERHDY